ncbi:MAG: DUF3300 domain-containing protein [Sulfuricaulis sp.]
MNRGQVRIIGGVLALFMVICTISTPIYPQDLPPTQVTGVFAPEQLDQLLAPVALYPDPLLGQILIAATYPLEVVQAERWLSDPDNSTLTGDALAAALQSQDWDPSVKSLVPFPQILQMMNERLDWMQQLGDAFLGQQAQVMDTVQRLRYRAQAAGTLESNTQQTVITQGQVIVIEPASPDVIYVPVYDPTVVYGNWPYPSYPPVYIPPPPDYDSGPAPDSAITFGLGFAIIQSFWGWDDWDWRDHRLHIDDDRFNRINGNHPPLKTGAWVHDPYHRRGVAYRNLQVRAQFAQHQPGATETRRDFRGYENDAHVSQRVPSTRAPQPIAPNRAIIRAPQTNGGIVREMPARPTVQRTLPPAFEGYASGTEVRAYVDRGRASRQTKPRANVAPRNDLRPRITHVPDARDRQRGDQRNQ